MNAAAKDEVDEERGAGGGGVGGGSPTGGGDASAAAGNNATGGHHARNRSSALDTVLGALFPNGAPPPGDPSAGGATGADDPLDVSVHRLTVTALSAERGRAMGPGERFLQHAKKITVEDGMDAVEGLVDGLGMMTRQRNGDEGYGGDADGGDGRRGDEESPTGVGGGGGDASSGSVGNQMYRLQATGGGDAGCCWKSLKFLNACINCGALNRSATEHSLYIGGGTYCDPNSLLVSFFFWLFRKGWLTIMAISTIWYYAFITFFAVLIIEASRLDPDCVRIGDVRLGDLPNRSKFIDSFSLSWNTFSTVGYGSTYPALSAENDGTGDQRCAFISLVTSLEALVGMVFAGFIGAIFYAKVSRITQRAKVLFSDPLTVRFGAGVDTDLGVEDDVDKPQNGKGDKAGSKKSGVRFNNLAKGAAAANHSPFPVLTFRIANEMHNVLGGEIISAKVNAVVLVESTRYDDQVSDELLQQISLDRRRRSNDHNNVKLRKGLSSRSAFSHDSSNRSEDKHSDTHTEGTVSSASSESPTKSAGPDHALNYLNSLSSRHFGGGRKMKIDDEDDGGGGDESGSKIIPRIVFTKLHLETSEHPLFKRIWRFKSILRPDSPLLTVDAQRAIMNNDGHWPWEWNNYEAVRKAIRFNQLVVSFTGISNISGASVYKQKVYEYSDIVVGYKFVDALYRGRHGALKVDLNLINDVSEQTGGGGEPLNMTEAIDPRVLRRFDVCQKVGSGAYGVVWKAVHRKKGNTVALKKCFEAFRCNVDAQRTYREVMYLKALSNPGHENIINVRGVIRASNDRDLYVTFDYIETDLSQVIKAKILEPIHIQWVTYQLLKALKYIHSASLLHRDIKPSNILVDSSCSIKVCDFGLCRSVSPGETPENMVLTDYIATRWYRPPEILMGSRKYSEGVDLWAVGCILGEMFRCRPLLPGASSMAQIEKIFEVTGNPSATDVMSWQSPFANAMLENVKARRVRLDELCPNLPKDAKHLIKSVLKLDPCKRCSAESALEHDYVADFHDSAKEITYPHGPIKIGISDNTKLTAADYRHKLYQSVDEKRGESRQDDTNKADQDNAATGAVPSVVSYDSMDRG